MASILIVRTVKSRYTDVQKALESAEVKADIHIVDGVSAGANAFRKNRATVTIADLPARDRVTLSDRIREIEPGATIFGVRRSKEPADEDGLESFVRPAGLGDLAARVREALTEELDTSGGLPVLVDAEAKPPAPAVTEDTPTKVVHSPVETKPVRASSGIEIRGNLVERNPCDVLLELHEDEATGVLTLVRGGSVKEFFLANGAPYHARSSERSESLAEVLNLSTADRDAVFQYLQEHDVTFTDALVAKGLVTPTDAELLKVRASRARIVEGLGWVQGTYSFVSGAPASVADAQKVKGLPGAVELVFEALDRASTGDRVREFARAYQDWPVQEAERFPRYRKAFEAHFGDERAAGTFASRVAPGHLLADLVQSGTDPARDLRQAYILHAAGFIRLSDDRIVSTAATVDPGTERSGAPVETARVALETLEKDPSAREARRQMLHYLRDGSVEPLFLELADRASTAVADARDASGYLADLHCEVGEGLHRVLHRMGEAAARYRRALKADPKCRRARAACRAIYGMAGEHGAVAKLYEEELKLSKNDDERADVHIALGRLAMLMLSDPASAAAHLRKALELRSLDAGAQQALAEAYLGMGLGPEGRYAQRAADSLCRLARIRLSQDPPDWAGALDDCKRALEAEPESQDALELLERIYHDSGAWAELEELYRRRLPQTSGAAKISILRKLAGLEDVGRAGVSRMAFEEMIAEGGTDPAYDMARTSLRNIYERASDWRKLAALREGDIARCPDAHTRNKVRLELAEIYFTRLGRPARAADWVVEALLEEPASLPALDWARLRFARRGDWAMYIDILNRSLQTEVWRGEKNLDKHLNRLEEMSNIAEKRLYDPQQSLQLWQRIQRLVPSDPIARRMIGRLSAPPAPDDPVRRLEQEAAGAATASAKLSALRKLGSTWTTRDVRRAIMVYEEILQIEREDEAALESMDRLLRNLGDIERRAQVLRRRIDVSEDSAAQARMLAALAQLRHDRLGDPSGALAACRELLRIDPRNSTANNLRRLIFEETENAEGLLGVLAHRAQYATDPETQASMYAEMAELAEKNLRQDDRAADLWERVLEVHPSDPNALAALRGIYERLERWDDLARVLERLAREAAPGSSERAELWRQLAHLISQELEDADRELQAWKELAAVRPLDAQAWEGQAEILASLEQWEEWAPVAARLVPLIRDRERAADTARNAAGILEHKLKRPDDASEILQSYIDRHSARGGEIAEELGRLHERRADWHGAIAAYELQMFAAGPQADRAAIAQRIADLWRERLEEPGPAILAYQRLQAFHPDATEGWTALGLLAERKGDHRNLAVVREAQLKHEKDPKTRLAVLLETADLYESRGGDVDRAVALLRQAATEAPDAQEPIDALEKLAMRHGRWDALMAVYEDRARDASPQERVRILHEVASVCATRLKDVDGAIAAYRRAYVLHPEVQGSLPALVNAVEEHDRWSVLVEAYLSRARAATDAEAVELMRKAADVYLEKTEDVDSAMAILRRASENHPDVPEALQALREAARSYGRWDDLITYYEERVEETEGAPRVSLLHEIAAIQDTELGQVDDALATLRRAYDLDPGEPEALQQLEGTLIAKRRWEDLLELLDERAKVALPADRVELLHRAARICKEELGDADRQIAQLKRAVQLAPDQPSAVDAYHDALKADERWEDMVELHRALANRTTDPQRRLEHIDICVDLLRNKLDDFQTAFTVRRNLFDAAILDMEALAELEDIAHAGGLYEDLGLVYREVQESLPEEAGEQGFVILSRLAEVLETHLDSPEAAYSHYLSAFSAKPGDPGTVEHLRRLAEQTENWSPLVGVHQTMAQMTGDHEEKIDLLRRNAVILEEHLSEEEAAFASYLEAFGYDPEDETLRQEVWRLAQIDSEREKVERGGEVKVREDGTIRPPQRWARLIQVYEARMTDAEDAEDRVRYLRRIGRIFAVPIADLDQAFNVLLIAARVNPENEQPLDDMERYGRDASEWDKVITHLRHHIDSLDDRKLSVRIYNRMARVAEEELDDSTRAEEYSRRALAMVGDDDESLARLKRILRKGGRGSDLAATLHREANEAEGEERRRVLLELAQLWESELNNPREAAQVYERILSENEQDAEALRKLVELYEETRDTRRLVDALKRQASAAEDPAERDATMRRVGRLYMDVLQEPRAALEIFRTTFEETAKRDDVDRESLASLSELYERLRRWDELLVITRIRAQVARDEPEERMRVLIRQARILEEHKNEPEKAAEILRGVLKKAPDNRDARAALIRNLKGAGEWDELIGFVESILPGTTGAEAASLHAALGDAHFRLGHNDMAASSFDQALQLDPASRQALSGRRAICEWQQEWAAAVELTEREAELAEGDEKVELYRRAAELRRDKLEDAEGARQLLRAALSSRPDSAEVARALTGFADGRGDWELIVAALEARLTKASSKRERADILVELGRSRSRGFLDRDGALDCFDDALEARPGHVPALVGMAELFDAEGELDDEGVAIKMESELAEAMQAGDLPRDSEDTGKLYLYYARALLAQEKSDEAVKALRRARDKHPRLLHVAMGLAESLYDELRFAEAEPHYRAVVEHVTAHDNQREVAEAYYRLGLIARARGNLDQSFSALERAAENEERASEALLGAAQIARENEDAAREVTYLERLVGRLSDPAIRATFRGRIGHLYLESLNDEPKALAAYDAAWDDEDAAETVSWDVGGPLLTLLLDTDDLDGAREVAETLDDVDDWEETEALDVHLALSRAFSRLGDAERARKHIDRAREADPESEAAFAELVRHHRLRKEWRPLSELIEGRLNRLPKEDDDRVPLLLELARVLTDGLNDRKRTAELLEEADRLRPDDAEIARAQIALLGEQLRTPEELLELHRRVLQVEPWNVSLMRASIALLKRIDAPKRTYWPAAVLQYFGIANDEEKQLADYHRPGIQRMGGEVMDVEKFAVLSHPDARMLEPVFKTVWDSAFSLFAESGNGLEREHRVSPVAKEPVARAFKYASRLLGTRVKGLYRPPVEESTETTVEVVLTRPPALVARGSEEIADRQLMFRFGRALQACRPEYIAFVAHEDAVTARILFDGIMGAFHTGVRLRTLNPAARDMSKQLRRTMRVRSRERVAEVMRRYAAAHPEPDFDGWNRAVWAGLDRAGVLMCGDLPAALDVVLGVENPGDRPSGEAGLRQTCDENVEVADLLRFVIGADFWWLRGQLGFEQGWIGRTSADVWRELAAAGKEVDPEAGEEETGDTEPAAADGPDTDSSEPAPGGDDGSEAGNDVAPATVSGPVSAQPQEDEAANPFGGDTGTHSPFKAPSGDDDSPFIMAASEAAEPDEDAEADDERPRSAETPSESSS